MRPREKTARPDEDLIRSAVAGDRHAFTALIRRYEQTVYGFAFKVCGNPEKAREALQDTFINVFRKLESFDGKSKFSTWLYSIVSNNCLMNRRRRKIDELLESLDDPPSIPGGGTAHHADRWSETPVELLLTKELRMTLERALGMLPVDYRVAFVLRDMEEKSTRETATILNISEEAVKSRLRRARAFLREQLHPYMAAEEG